ncbi:hypothetical protein KPH14_002155 [Odynerus spinipes]|uniref:H15 domain-containing protein n=1 Tax=Odynerus spinipes TaxID=1348599 RepID=A0AAD9VNW1_9HYME|nr:hypothetical protein KPH14_002155 [Odynerus spinipes]
MVRPSNPLLMSAVLDAVAHLSEGKGSKVRDILNFVRQNSNGGVSRNLTMQVHRALKHAVNAGLLRHQGGRYKVLISVNPISAQQSLPEDSKSGDDIADKVPNGSPERSKRRVKDPGKQQNNKRPNRKRARSKSGQAKYGHPRKRANPMKETKVPRKQKRKANAKVEDREDWMPPTRRKCFAKCKQPEVVQVDASPSSGRSRDEICISGSDVSDDSTYERSTNPKSKFHAHDEGRALSPERKRSLACQEPKRQRSKARSRKRSTSRNRSPQRQNYNQNQNQQQHQQLQIQELPNDHLDDIGMVCEQVSGNVERNDEPANPDTDRTCKANNSGSGSSL